MSVRSVFLKKQTRALWTPERSRLEHSLSTQGPHPKCKQTCSDLVQFAGWGTVELARPPYVPEAREELRHQAGELLVHITGEEGHGLDSCLPNSVPTDQGPCVDVGYKRFF